MQTELERIISLGATLVAVSPQTPDASLSTADKNQLTFHVLSDLGNRVARDFGLVVSLSEDVRNVYARLGHDIIAANGDESFELPLPATFVIDTEGMIRLAFVAADHTQRIDPLEVISVLESLR